MCIRFCKVRGVCNFALVAGTLVACGVAWGYQKLAAAGTLWPVDSIYYAILGAIVMAVIGRLLRDAEVDETSRIL